MNEGRSGNMDLPSREEAINVVLEKRRLDYVETIVPQLHYNERCPKEDTILGTERVVYAFAADDNLHHYMATLQYFVLKGGMPAWKPPQSPLPSVSWAIARKQCSLMRTELPISSAEPARFVNGEGVLYYSPIGGKYEGKHGVFIFSSDPIVFPPRVEIRLKFSEEPLCPDVWKPLILQVIAGTTVLC